LISRLKLGLIGCGDISRLVHLNVLTQLPGVELVALAEPDMKRREQAAGCAPSARSFAGYEELLGMPDVEAVVICLPNALHTEATVAALRNGKHVYLEKPLATNLAEGRRVLNAWRHSGLVGMIGFNYRFNVLYQTARRHIQSGKLGELVGARSVFSSAARILPEWKRNRRTGGGVLLDVGSHHVDLVRFFFGQEICSVFAEVRSQQSECDSAVLQLQLANGLLVQSFFSLNTVDEDRFEIYGQSGKLAVDRFRSLKVEFTDAVHNFLRLKRLAHELRSIFRSPYLINEFLAPSHEPSYKAALNRFVEAVRGEQPASPDFEDGYRVLTVIEAAEESARGKRSVSLSSITDEDLAR